MGDNPLIHFRPFRFTSSPGEILSSRKLSVEFESAFQDGPSYEAKWVDENENGKLDMGDRIGFVEYAFSFAPGKQRSINWNYEMRDVGRSDILMYRGYLGKTVSEWNARIDRFKLVDPKGLKCRGEADEMTLSFDWTAGFWAMDSLADDSINYFERMVYPPIFLVESILKKGSPDYTVMRSAFKACFEKSKSPYHGVRAPMPHPVLMPPGQVPAVQP